MTEPLINVIGGIEKSWQKAERLQGSVSVETMIGRFEAVPAQPLPGVGRIGDELD
jgi:hypothetical protein